MTANLLKSTALGAALTLIAGGAMAQGPILVTSAADAGEGTLRAALEAASAAQAPSQIVIVTEGDIEVASTLDYAGRAPLVIIGNGQTVRTGANATLLAVTEGADLMVSDLNFAGPGGFDIENRGDMDGATAGKGIFVDVRDDQTGTVMLDLVNVTVSGVANHGVHVSDCSLADECGGGSGGAGEGSPASIAVRLTNVTIDDAGNGKFDADGLRVDERAEGGISAVLTGSTFVNVGADGVELDEGQNGDVVVAVSNSVFADNGAYCDPDLLNAFMPETDEGEFEDGAAQEADIPGEITGSPDDSCFEREVDFYDSGAVEEFEIGIDLDDGFDVDEAGPGGLHAVVSGSDIRGNLDEGLDFDEEGPGGVNLAVLGSTATGNNDDGFKTSEEDEGGVEGLLFDTTAKGNGGKGAVFEEEDAGGLRVMARSVTTADNDDSDKTGLEIVQEDAGQGVLMVQGSDIADGIDAEGVEVAVE